VHARVLLHEGLIDHEPVGLNDRFEGVADAAFIVLDALQTSADSKEPHPFEAPPRRSYALLTDHPGA